MYNVICYLFLNQQDIYMEWWHSGQYFCLSITRSVGQLPLRTLIYALSSSYIAANLCFSIIDVKLMFVEIDSTSAWR